MILNNKTSVKILLVAASIFILNQCSHKNKTQKTSRDIAGLTMDASGYLYDPQDISCDGYPRLKVDTAPGTCLGLVLPQNKAINPLTQKPWIMPRTIVQIPQSENFLVVDMGGWKANNGTLYLMFKNAHEYSITPLKSQLDLPHGLAISKDGFFYLGENAKISRFKILNNKLSVWQTVVSDLPSFKGHMHPLTQIAFDPRNNDLFINSGAPSDKCFVKTTGDYAYCPEEHTEGLGGIYRIPGEHLKNLPKEGVRFYEVTALGLRNSMAMTVHPSGHLIQGENARDFEDVEEPYEEINVIDLSLPGFHYGWPYCYNMNALSPEWLFEENKNHPLRIQFQKPVDCKTKKPIQPGDYAQPWILMPPHVAPLHMEHYQGQMFPKLKNHLVISWHGYQPAGQRLVAYATDEKGRPLVANTKIPQDYSFNQSSGCAISKKFTPRGGTERFAKPLELISGWNAIKGIRPKGAPVGFTFANDGAIWIVEDRNVKTITRLAKIADFENNETNTCLDQQENEVDPKVKLLAWRQTHISQPQLDQSYQKIQTHLFQKYCTGCHGNFQETEISRDRYSALDYLMKNQWVQPGLPAQSKLFDAISQMGGVPPMPPGGTPQFYGTPEGEFLLSLVSDWIKNLPQKRDDDLKQIRLKKDATLFTKTEQGAQACGRFLKNDLVIVDESSPRPPQGWKRIFVTPQSPKLFAQACAYPTSGAYYIRWQP